MPGKSNGYEAIAEAFLRARNSSIGPAAILEWASRLPAGIDILDLGCGSGVPISEALLNAGFQVYGVDASPTLTAKFRERFPAATVECCPVEDSAFFHRTFDAVVSWGLFFLLPPAEQVVLIAKVANTLNPGGHFLFTSPAQILTWSDAMTDLPSVSLGHDAYAQALAANGLRLDANTEDNGQNYYYFASKPKP